MEPTELDGQLQALALIRASVEDDQEGIAALMADPPSACFIVSMAAIASSTLERAHGKDGALRMVDGWIGLTLDLATGQKNPRARGAES